ncbi:MAG: sigma-70 family RNA polymerase sigma factor [Candidatus Kapaibacterium sp.]|jgi:RNA polymerase sigma factor (sigma-70 family)
MEGTPIEVHQVIDHLFRRESGKVVALLARQFGFDKIDLAEDIVQEVMLKALAQWPGKSMPEDPARWMLATARNLAIDHLRRQSFLLKHSDEIADHFESLMRNEAFIPILSHEVEDDMLRMIFTCCHPILSRESQIALALRTLVGFSTRDIAAVLQQSEATVTKRIVRAKTKMREALVQFEVPSGTALEERSNAVANILYLMFSLGFRSGIKNDPLGKELCEDALRLTLIVASHPICERPMMHALVAIMYFQLARFDTRTTPGGDVIPVREQDRSRWDADMIAKGFAHLAKSAAGETITEYHLEAGILGCHCKAATYDETSWEEIVSLYDILITINDSELVHQAREFAVQEASLQN